MIKKEDMVFDLIKDGKCVSEIKRLTNTNTTNLSMILYNLGTLTVLKQQNRINH